MHLKLGNMELDAVGFMDIMRKSANQYTAVCLTKGRSRKLLWKITLRITKTHALDAGLVSQPCTATATQITSLHPRQHDDLFVRREANKLQRMPGALCKMEITDYDQR